MRLHKPGHNRSQSSHLRLVVTAVETRAPDGRVMRLEIQPTELAVGAPEIEIADADILDVEFDLDQDASAIIAECGPPQFLRRAA